MRKLLFILPLIILSSCLIQSQSPSLSYNILGIKETNSGYELKISLIRPDQNFRQSPYEMSVTDLQDKIKVSELSINGVPCDIDVLPHKCLVSDLSKPGKLSATFQDTTLETDMILPNFEFSMESPEIELPSEPEDDKTVLQFTDVSADSYEFTLNTCYNEENCVSSKYLIEKEDEIWKINAEDEIAFFAEISHPANSIKVVLKIDDTLFSKIDYQIKAQKKWQSANVQSLSSEKTTIKSFTF